MHLLLSSRLEGLDIHSFSGGIVSTDDIVSIFLVLLLKSVYEVETVFNV